MVDKKNVGTASIRLLPADLRRLDQGYGFQSDACSGAAEYERGQIPPASLLLAAILSGSLWWGIIAGIRLVWPAI